MKIKVKPEDFQVSEIAHMNVTRKKDHYMVYSLTKSSWDTFDLLNFLARELKISEKDISVGGMKDRYGQTEQRITIRTRATLPHQLKYKNFTLQFLGYTSEKITAENLTGNLFDIVLRDLKAQEWENVQANVAALAAWGLPNYYDEQRFGSARHNQGYMGKELFLGNREQALKLYLWPSKHDRKEEKVFKKCVITNWGQWEKCLPVTPPKYKKMILYLAEKGHHYSFAKALTFIERRMLMLALHAYQSYLFNMILARYTTNLAAENNLKYTSYPFKYGDLVFYHELTPELLAELRDLKLPVPGHNSEITDKKILKITEEVLAADGIALADLKVKKLYKTAVGGVDRQAIVLPEECKIVESGADELYPTAHKCRLRFTLPRGSYATLVLKRLTLKPPV